MLRNRDLIGRRPRRWVITYTYDKAGNRTSLTVDPDGGGPLGLTTNTAYTFDALNRMETVVDAGGTTTYTYDAVGNRESVTYPNLTRAEYAYDTLNRLTSINNFKDVMAGALGTGDLISSFTYTLGLAGNRLQVFEDLGEAPGTESRTVEYEYDDLYRLTREFASEADLTTREQLFGYDDVGNRLDLTLVQEGTTVLTHQTVYSYDDNDRLNSEVTADYTPMASINLPADSPLATARSTARWSTNSLIGFGAASLVACLAPLGLIRGRRMGKRAYRRRMLNACVAAFFIPLMAISPETVQAAHIEAMTARAITAAAVGQTCGGVRCVNYGYDDNGNMHTKTVDDGQTSITDTFTYDYENRLTDALIFNGSQAVEGYTYDADGIRVSKTVDAAVHSYVIDKNRPYAQVIEEAHPAFGLFRYVHGDDLIKQDQPNGVSYYLYDGQMSVRQLTNDIPIPAAVSITDTYTYDAFGQEIKSCGVTLNDYRYTGEQRDANTGFYYLRARYMDPAIGRFVTRDPFGGSTNDPMSLHKYLYVGANPVNNWDPSGLAGFGFNLPSLLGAIGILSVLGGIINVGVTAATNRLLGRSNGLMIAFGRGFLSTAATLGLLSLGVAPWLAFGAGGFYGSFFAAWANGDLDDGGDLGTVVHLVLAFILSGLLGGFVNKVGDPYSGVNTIATGVQEATKNVSIQALRSVSLQALKQGASSALSASRNTFFFNASYTFADLIVGIWESVKRLEPEVARVYDAQRDLLDELDPQD